jgi:hypothetical protein
VDFVLLLERSEAAGSLLPDFKENREPVIRK